MTFNARGTAEADLSAYVLSTLDHHLRALQDVRDRLRMGSTTDIGARRVLAIDAVALAGRFAEQLCLALGLPAAVSCEHQAGRDECGVRCIHVEDDTHNARPATVSHSLSVGTFLRH